VVDAWPELPDALKAGIVAMVRAHGREALHPGVSRAAILTPKSDAGNSNRTHVHLDGWIL
jgi:hypothetical protein